MAEEFGTSDQMVTAADLLTHIEVQRKIIAGLEAEAQATVEAIIPPNRDKCSDCGHPLVWCWAESADSVMTGPSTLLCPRCVLARTHVAECRVVTLMHEVNDAAHGRGKAEADLAALRESWAKAWNEPAGQQITRLSTKLAKAEARVEELEEELWEAQMGEDA